MKHAYVSLLCGVALIVSGCDLQPKIASLPDSVGDFISVRYPALLADPDAQPEIYNSAATDYGVYAAPELYGDGTVTDYVLYASVNDYIIPPQQSADITKAPDDFVPDVVPSEPQVVDTVVTEPDAGIKETSKDVPTNDYLVVPMYGGGVVKNADASQITVARGDTLYSLARTHNMTVADLARINKLSEPYALKPGQVLKLKSEQAADIAPSAPETVNHIAADNGVTNTASQAASTVLIEHPKPTTTRVELQEITVGVGDTLYSLSRKYSVPVNDLAVMNNLSAPFGLYAGQQLKVPNLSAPDVRVASQIAPTPIDAEKKTGAIVVQPKAAATLSTPVANTARVQTPVTSTKPVATNTNAKSATTGGGQNKSVTNAKNATSATTKTDTAKTSTMPTSKTASNAKTASATAQTKISSDPSKKLPTIAARSSSKFSWPVRGRVLSDFGTKPNGLVNDGINIGATRGTAVKSAENGVVAYAGNEVKGMGNLVIIQHSGGWMTVYAHMDSMSVRRGSKVSVGQKIGTVGTTGKVDKPQLHFEIRKGTKAYNPVSYLKK